MPENVDSFGVKRLPVTLYGNPILRRKSAVIETVTPEIRDLAAQMTVTMFENETPGIGLAAPQVGVNLRLITLAVPDPSSELPPNASPGERLLGPMMPLALVNPEVVPASTKVSSCEEGCLSIPEISAEVIRPVSVMLRASTLDGRPISVECGGMLARCLQHEVDHLDGILFVDRATEFDKRQIADDLHFLEKRVLRRLKKTRATR